MKQLFLNIILSLVLVSGLNYKVYGDWPVFMDETNELSKWIGSNTSISLFEGNHNIAYYEYRDYGCQGDFLNIVYFDFSLNPPALTGWDYPLNGPISDINMEIDSLGQAHICYHSQAYDWDLYYIKAYWDNGMQWEVVNVDDESISGQYASLKIDILGRPCISYYQENQNPNDYYGVLKFAYEIEPGVWQNLVIDDGGYVNNVGLYTSMDIDQHGNAHISYYDSTNGSLKYISGIWNPVEQNWNWDLNNIQVIDCEGITGWNSSIACARPFNNFDLVRVCYYDVSNKRLKHALKDPANPNWRVYEMNNNNSGPGYGYESHLSVDSHNGLPRICYYDNSYNYNTQNPIAKFARLKYAAGYYSGGYLHWNIDTIIEGANAGWDSSIIMDSNGNPIISYINNWRIRENNLKYNTVLSLTQ